MLSTHCVLGTGYVASVLLNTPGAGAVTTPPCRGARHTVSVTVLGFRADRAGEQGAGVREEGLGLHSCQGSPRLQQQEADPSSVQAAEGSDALVGP